MAWIKIGSIEQIPPGSVMEAIVGDRTFAMCNVAGEVHVLDGSCPHVGGPLGQGALDGGNVVCPWHAWEFDCRTGMNDHNEDVAVRCFPVRMDGADILIDAD
jgi:nitrite reductase/ring-hydroxylating ferredoxin subunit